MNSQVLSEDYEIVPRLVEYGLPKEVLLNIFDRAVGERANVNSNDPMNTPGNEMRRWLTRYLREDLHLKMLGWVPCAYNQLEGIRNDLLKRKLVVLNTDARAGMPSKEPISISDKGPAAERVIKGNEDRRQSRLFEDPVSAADEFADYDFLYFCVHVSDESQSAEISRPSGLVGGFVAHYSERIMLLSPGEKPGLRRSVPIAEEFAEVEKPTVVRRV